MEPEVLQITPEWIALNKPPGWLSVPGRAPLGPPVVAQWAGEKWGKLWTVHRLDKETSGVLLLAKTAEAHRKANQWFERHEIKKKYVFIAQGQPSAPVFKVQMPIDGAPSLTQFEVLKRWPDCFYGQATPLTGRTHQIRIHLKERGHAILGDTRYGGMGGLGFDRVALHALILALPSGEKFEAPLPADFLEFQRLRKEQT